jgi:hypothetical protein
MPDSLKEIYKKLKKIKDKTDNLKLFENMNTGKLYNYYKAFFEGDKSDKLKNVKQEFGRKNELDTLELMVDYIKGEIKDKNLKNELDKFLKIYYLKEEIKEETKKRE